MSLEGLKRLFYWLLVGSRGGPTRLLVIMRLKDGPANANQLAAHLKLNYKTVQHHLEILTENRLVVPSDGKYNVVYSLSPELLENLDILQSIINEVSRVKGVRLEKWAWGFIG